MKKTDIAMIILIAGVSVLMTYFIANSFALFKDANKPVSVKVAEKITPDFDKVDTTIFNKDAINPTVEVIIGGNSTAAAQSNGSGVQSSQANENQ